MKIKMTAPGDLTITPDTIIEAYALKTWLTEGSEGHGVLHVDLSENTLSNLTEAPPCDS